RDAQFVRDLLGRRGRRGKLARRRRGAARDHPRHAPRGRRDRTAAPARSADGRDPRALLRVHHRGRIAKGMRPVKSAVLGGWSLVVGDAWRTAVGVVLALGLTAVIEDAGISAWWLLPVAVVVLLALSLRRAVRPR